MPLLGKAMDRGRLSPHHELLSRGLSLPLCGHAVHVDSLLKLLALEGTLWLIGWERASSLLPDLALRLSMQRSRKRWLCWKHRENSSLQGLGRRLSRKGRETASLRELRRTPRRPSWSSVHLLGKLTVHGLYGLKLLRWLRGVQSHGGRHWHLREGLLDKCASLRVW